MENKKDMDKTNYAGRFILLIVAVLLATLIAYVFNLAMLDKLNIYQTDLIKEIGFVVSVFESIALMYLVVYRVTKGQM